MGVTGLHLCFLPWALGAMHIWSQFTSLGLSIIGFVLATLPRAETEDFPLVSGASRRPAAKLLRFPIFWAGLVLLGYIAVQGFNPAWRYTSVGALWWVKPIPHVSWLPSGVEAPFFRSNSWRALTIDGSLWLLVCSVWAGFLRRKSYLALFTLLAANAFLLALLGILQKLNGTYQIFWSYQPSNYSFIASFIYPNHAGAYFNLMVALAAGLAWWHHQRARRHLEKPGLAVVLVLFAVFTGIAVVFSNSRMSIISLLAFTVFLGCTLGFRLFRQSGPVRDRAEFLPLAIALAGLLGIGLATSRVENAWARFAEMMSRPVVTDRARTLLRQAGGDMLRDRWLLGWGAGCFRYNFPDYARKYPEIHYFTNGKAEMYWEHAHDDLLEFPIELGAAGLLPLGVVLGCGAWQLGRRRFWRNAVSSCIVLGGALVLMHAWVDFVFQNPAVLLTWGVLLVGAARWAELDQPGGRRQAEVGVQPELGRPAGRAPVPAASGRSGDGRGGAEDESAELRSTRDEF